jgi:hypothetical protein
MIMEGFAAALLSEPETSKGRNDLGLKSGAITPRPHYH